MKAPLFVLFLCIASAPAQTPLARKALVIGNSGYLSLPALGQTKANAELVANALREVHFDTTLKLDMDQKTLLSSVGAFQSSIQPGDIVFVYYSGYALQGEEGTGCCPWGSTPKAIHASRGTPICCRDSGRTDCRIRTPYCCDRCHHRSARPCQVGCERRVGHEQRKTTDPALFFHTARTQRPAQPGPQAGPFARSLAAAIKTPGLLPIQVFGKVQKDVLTETKVGAVPMFVPFVANAFYFIDPPPPPK